MAVNSSRRIEDALDDILAALAMRAPDSPQPISDARRLEDALDDILAAVAAQADGSRRLESLMAQLLEVMMTESSSPELSSELVAALRALSERSDVPEVEFDFERFAKVIRESMPKTVSTSSGLGSVAVQKVLERVSTEATLQAVLDRLDETLTVDNGHDQPVVAGDLSTLATKAKQDNLISGTGFVISVLNSILTRLGQRLSVSDKDTTLEVLADQAGADGVLTFTFTAASTGWVSVDEGDPVRVTDGSQTPTATFGVPVAAGSPFPLPVSTTTLRVWAASGQTVSVYGTR